MHRYATAPRSTFEELFEQARSGRFTLDAADYPPVCGGRSGEVSLSLGRTGAMIVHVEPGECRADEFRLKLLFETGTCVFSTPLELWRFWTGPVAEAFGIEPTAVAPDTSEPAGDAVPDTTTARHTAPVAAAEPAPLTELETERATTLTTARLAAELALVIHGQDAALERVASATATQLRKRHPARPGSVALLGPTGAGKTATVEALPAALKSLGHRARVFRLDCGELTDSIQLTRLLGSPPGFSGHAATTPLLAALERPGCILLVDEVDKAHPDLLDLLLGLLDAGRMRSPGGQDVDARHIVVALTTSVDSEELLGALRSTPLADRWAVQRVCADHLRGAGVPSDLVGRIGAFAAFSALDGPDARQGIAESAIVSLAAEYGLVVDAVDPVVVEVVEDIAHDSGDAAGARALHHAARELLAECFAGLAGDGPPVHVAIDAGPPLAVTVSEAARRHG